MIRSKISVTPAAVAVAAGLVLSAMPAQAAFLWEASPPPPAAVQKGSLDGPELLVPAVAKNDVTADTQAYDPANVHGFGTDIPLLIAVSQIVPPDVTVQWQAGIDSASLVSWSGGRPWQQVLTETVSQINGTVDYSGTSVMIRPAAVASAPVAPIAVSTPAPQSAVEVPPTALVPMPGQAPMPATVPVAAPSSPADDTFFQDTYNRQATWFFQSGTTLQDVLAEWADKAGWQLDWQATEVYPITGSGSVTGTFQEAVTQLINAFRDLPRPPKATGYLKNTPPVVAVFND